MAFRQKPIWGRASARLGDFAELIEPTFKRVLETQQPILNLEICSTLPTRTEPGHWIEHYIPIKDSIGKVSSPWCKFGFVSRKS